MAGQYVPERDKVIVVQTRNVLEALAGMRKASGTLSFSTAGTEASVTEIYGQKFEIRAEEADVAAGNIWVDLGADAEETRDNFLAALDELTKINPDVDLVTATATGDGVGTDFGISLRYYDVGTVGNDVIATDDLTITVTGMSGGVDGGEIDVKFDGEIVIATVQVKNGAGTTINPATLESVQAIGTLLGTPAQAGEAAAATALLATEATLTTLDGKITACDTGAIVTALGTVAQAGEAAAATALLATEVTAASIDSKITACDTGAVITALGSPAQAGEAATATALLATEVTAASIDAKITACDTGAIVTALGSVAQAGEAATATASLALEAGGNLALIKTNTDASAGRASSGVAAMATVDDNAITLIAADGAKARRGYEIVVESGIAGSFSVDGGTTWEHSVSAPGTPVVIGEESYLATRPAILFKRIAGGTNVTGIYAREW